MINIMIELLLNMSIQLNKTQITLSKSILAMKYQLQSFHHYYRLSNTTKQKKSCIRLC